MNAETISQLFKERFIDRSLVLVSNREPYIHRKTKQGIRIDRPAGGLTSALDPVMRALHGTWIAWGSGSADAEMSDENGKLLVPPDDPSYTLKRVWLGQKEVDGFYYGFSNQALWPLCHMLLEKSRFKPRHWRRYFEVNRKFADAVVPEIKNQRDVVWIQDYHFTLMPYMLRSRLPQLTLAMFWHIPWPPWEIFRVLPQHLEILKGMLGCSLIGFHIQRYCDNFMECVGKELHAEIDPARNKIFWDGREISLAPLPISIDFDHFDGLARSEKSGRKSDALRTKLMLRERRIGIGVDRLDYSKGIRERIEALQVFFDRYPEYRCRFTFIQIAVPSRTKIQEYSDLKRQVENLIERINERHGTPDWKPILYFPSSFSHAELVHYYRIADMAIVSSIQDGMNLVAKEYVASQIDENGVLILSEFVGAVDELTAAVTINPFDVDHFALMIKKALEMPEAEKRRRMEKMRSHVRTHTIFDWINDNLNAVESETL